MKHQEGTIPTDGYKVWYRRVGEGGIPLLTLHGGPGAGHDYLESLEGLAEGREVIFYDQLGCGRSDQPADTSLWRIERFVEEVNKVRDALGLKQIHLLGQSWGGWLAIEYMLSKPKGVVSLVLASTSSSIPQFVAEAEKLKAALPPDLYATMQRCEATGDYQNPDYLAAVQEFYRRHLCRLDPWPEPLERSTKIIEGNPVYLTMNGPNEFVVNGNLKDWNRTERLHEISVPTLITVGHYDEITPACAQTMHERIAGSKLRQFEHSSHTAHLEETEAYLQTLSEFLKSVEQAGISRLQTIQPEGIYQPATYNHAIKAGNTIYVAGQVARDANGVLVAPGDGAAQARQVYHNLGRVLEAAGAKPEHVVKVTTYLVDAADSKAVSEVRLEFFGSHRPPHTGLIVAALGGPEVKVEVEVIAVLPDHD